MFVWIRRQSYKTWPKIPQPTHTKIPQYSSHLGSRLTVVPCDTIGRYNCHQHKSLPKNSPEIISRTPLKIHIFYFPNMSKYSNFRIFNEYSFPLFYSYDYKIQNSSIQTQISIILVSKFLSNYSPSNPVIPSA
jgi:hypothetical protein